MQYLDKVPRPDSYIYYVAAVNGAAGRRPATSIALNVPPSGACVQPAGYKQVMFQPLTFQPRKPGPLGAALYLRPP